MKEGTTFVTLPTFYHVVRALDQVIDVDYYLPGCPPTPKLLKQALEVLLSGKLPEKGAILAPDIALCDECPKKDTKPSDLKFTEFKRPHWTHNRSNYLPACTGYYLYGTGDTRRV